MPRRVANRRRLRPLERGQPGYAIVNDSAHDYSILHYYISRDAQARQLRARLRLVEALDLEARPVEPARTPRDSSELHYVARRG